MTTPGNETPARRVRNPRDLVAGLAMVAVAAFALWASADLPGIRGFQFGAGTAPRLLAILLLGIGAVIAGLAFVKEGPGQPQFGWRGLLVVTGSLLLFAAAVRPLGLMTTTFVMFLAAASGSGETRWTETVVAAFAMTALTYLTFIVALEIPFEPWPRFLVR